MDRLSKDARFAKVEVFQVDFDKHKDALKQWKVSQQGTMLAFKGTVEKARSTGDTDAAALEKIFAAAL